MTEPSLLETARALHPPPSGLALLELELGQTLRRPFQGPSGAEGVLGIPSAIVAAVTGVLTMPGDLVDTTVAALSSAIIPPGFGFPAARLGVFGHIGLPHLHALPGPPFLGLGPTVGIGALSVHIGFLPALRTGDVGISPLCLAPIFKIFTGSANVFVGGKRAARMLDITEHCPFVGGRGTASSAAAEHAFESAVDALTLVQAATGILAQAGAAGHYALGDDPPEVVVVQVRAQVDQAITGIEQAVGDVALTALHAMIGTPPPLLSCGAGLLVPMLPLATLPNVMIGGLPVPELGTMANGRVMQWMRTLRAWQIRAGRRLAQGRGLRCAIFGHPVRAVDGSVFADHVDVDLGGLRFARRYDTLELRRTFDCGRGMRHSFERELDVWLHRCSYVDHEGTRVDFPAFRGRDRVSLHGYVVERFDGARFEITHRGETMVFVATAGVRGARLDAIRTASGTIAIEHDEEGRFRAARLDHCALVVRRDRDGRVVSLRDERGNERAAFAYERGCLVASRNAEQREERFTYDEAHRLTAWRDPRGVEFIWRYDAEGRCVHTSGQGRQWSCDFVYEKYKTLVTHGSGLSVTIHYDAYGTVLRVVRSDGGFLLREQDETGRIVRERDAAGRIVEWLYDETGENTGRRDRFGNMLPPERNAPRVAADPRARDLPATLAPQLGFAPAASERATTIPDALVSLAAWALPSTHARAPHAERDALGRVVRITDARGLGVDVRRDAAGNVVEATDRDRRTSRALITGWNLIGSTIDPIGRSASATYTSTEEVRTYRDPLGQLTEYGRDAADRMTSVTRKGRLHETYAYDAGDRLVEKQGADGAWILRVAHHRNALPRKIELARGGSIELDYDARGRVTRASLGDHDARIERDEDGTILLDRCGPLGLRRWSFGARETTSLFDRFETQIDRSGDLTVVRDPTGRLTSFDAGGGRVVRHLGNGTREILAFGPEGHLEGRLAHRTASDGALRSWAVRYERSGEGDLLRVWDSARGERRFDIDAAHRLEAETDEAGAQHAFTHDAGDNVIARAEVTSESVLVRTKDETFTHDARGNLASRTRASGAETRYEYDSLDQLVGVTRADGTIWCGSYDGLGRLRRFGLEGHETTLQWDGDRIAAEVTSSGALRVHVYGSAHALIPFAFVDYASIGAEPESGRAYFVFHDASGMPLQIEDATGRTVWWAERVDPYGAITLHEGAELDYPLRWPGHYFDRDLALHHNRFRAYDPQLARYLQPDPIGHAGSPHSLYAYAANPLVAVDLLGLTCPTPAAIHTTAEHGEGHPLAQGAPFPTLTSLTLAQWRVRLLAHAEYRVAIGLINGRWAHLPSVFNAGWDPVARTLRFNPEGRPRERAAHPLAPNGVQYGDDGTPDLHPFIRHDANGAQARVVFEGEEGFSSNRSSNMAEANRRMSRGDADWRQPEGSTWHEHADGRTMELVSSKVHDACPHTGGIARRASLDRWGSTTGPPRGNGDPLPPTLPRAAREILAQTYSIDDPSKETP